MVQKPWPCILTLTVQKRFMIIIDAVQVVRHDCSRLTTPRLFWVR